MTETIQEADHAPGAPHPRETSALFGQQAAEAEFLSAAATGRMHHGWLLTGPRGVGKATLAWRIARYLLAEAPADAGLFDAPSPPQSLDIPGDHPVNRRLLALSEPRLFLLRRAWDSDRNRLKSVITVDEVRRLKDFFGLSATDGGRRIVIVDAADEMNPNAANALLKVLEEPPSGAVLLLVSHQPSRLLPTIRSRCRELRLATLEVDDMALALQAVDAETDNPAALAELSGGSVGAAIRLANQDGLALYAELVALLDTLPRLDRPRALKLAESVSAKGNEDRLDLLLTLIDLLLARLARAGVTGPPAEAARGEAVILQRLSPDLAAARAWAELQQRAGARARQGRAVNLDPVMLLLDILLQMNETAAGLTARQGTP